MRTGSDHRRAIADKVYEVDSGLSAVQRFVQVGRLHGVSERTCRNLYWDRVPLARSRRPNQARPRELDWRARFRAEAQRLNDIGDTEKAKAVQRIGWRLHCRQNRIQESEVTLRYLEHAQARDELLWDQLTSLAATDAPGATTAAEADHG